MHAMDKLAIVSTFVYAAVSIVGGLMGYLGPKQSVPSLIAGGAAGILLAVGGYFGLQGKAWGLVIVLLACVALLGKFLPDYLRDSSNVWPALVMVVLGVLTAVLVALGLPHLRKP